MSLTKEQEQFLHEQYFNPKNSASYSGFKRFWKKVRSLNKNFTKSQIQTWLRAQDTFTSFRPNVQKFKRPKIVVPYYAYEFGSDTAYMVKFSENNNDYKYFVVFIDYFTRYAWSYAMKTLTGHEMQSCMSRLFEEQNEKPEHLHTDKGSEYVNRAVKKYLRDQSVVHIVTGSDAKSSISEALIKNLKQRLFRYMYYKNTTEWYTVLDDVTGAYNTSIHSAIKMTPTQAKSSDAYDVWTKQHRIKSGVNKQTARQENPKTLGSKFRKPRVKKLYKFNVGDRVKISAAKTPFSRAYSEQFTTETFFVTKRKRRDGVAMYTLRDELGDEIRGQFYEREMTPVIVPDDKQYKIERVISSKRIKGKKHFLVKWQNFPAKYNSFVPEEDVVDI